MKKFLVFSGIAVVLIIILGAVVMFFMRKQTKSFSPEDRLIFSQDDLEINVFYNRPKKKGREIFGVLVPYGKVWRTGANEATTFETNKDLTFEGKKLKAGKYSLWTIPGEEFWTIIFNVEYGQWGISYDGEANRKPERDALTVEVRPVWQDRTFEEFTISFEKTGEEAEMVLIWDKTLVAVPFSYK
jgi:Protein of unknown function (DUF2911)